MRLEGYSDCFRANHPRAAHDFTENMRMRPMDAIEVADAHDGASKVGRYVIELVEDIHSKSLTAKFAKASQRTQRTSLRASGNSLRSLWSKAFFLVITSTFLKPLNLNFKLQLHPVIRQSHVGRQRCVRLLVRQIVTDMSEESALRPQSLDDLQ